MGSLQIHQLISPSADYKRKRRVRKSKETLFKVGTVEINNIKQ